MLKRNILKVVFDEKLNGSFSVTEQKEGTEIIVYVSKQYNLHKIFWRMAKYISKHEINNIKVVSEHSDIVKEFTEKFLKILLNLEPIK